MYIKLNIQDELLDLLQEESKDEFRSPTQQVMYILNKHYKGKLSSLKENNSIVNIPEVTKIHKEEQSVTISENRDQIQQNEEITVYDNTQSGQEDYDYIDDNMIDF